MILVKVKPYSFFKIITLFVCYSVAKFQGLRTQMLVNSCDGGYAKTITYS